jgi:mycothiol synthase
MTAGAGWLPAGAPDYVQLHMGRALSGHRGESPALPLPAGFELVRATAAQAPELAGVLGGNQELGEWDAERAQQLFEEGADAHVDACFLIRTEGRAVATAQLDVHDRGRYAGLAEMGWVAVLPESRGRRLGSAVSQVVLDAAEQLGHRQVFLRTDDWRTPAVVSYLRLGFRPWLVEPTASGRWKTFLHRVDPASRAIGEAGLEEPWTPAGPGWDAINWEVVASDRGGEAGNWDAAAGANQLDQEERGTSGGHARS